MRIISGAACAALVLLTAPAANAAARQVPNLDITPLCRGIASNPSAAGVAGGPDLSFKACVRSELNIRRRLQRQWGSFSAASKTTCVGSTTSALPSYTDLLTCLQLAKDAHR